MCLGNKKEQVEAGDCSPVTNLQLKERVVELEKAVRRLKKSFDLNQGNPFRNVYIEREIERTHVEAPTIACRFPEVYSQHGEDLIILSLLEARRGNTPFSDIRYLDIGANHPVNMSNTYLLYRKGASGVLVEPNPKLIAGLEAVRPLDKILCCGVQVNGLEEAELLITDQHELSSFSQEFIDDWNRRHCNGVEIVEKVDVPMVDINKLIETHLGGAPEVLSVDIEGYDCEVLSRLDFSRFRPWFVVVEWSESYQAGSKERLMELMVRSGYRLAADTRVNGVFECQ